MIALAHLIRVLGVKIKAILRMYTHTHTHTHSEKRNTQHQSRHLRMILEIVSREAFRLARELFHIRLTKTQTDRQTH